MMCFSPLSYGGLQPGHLTPSFPFNGGSNQRDNAVVLSRHKTPKTKSHRGSLCCRSISLFLLSPTLPPTRQQEGCFFLNVEDDQNTKMVLKLAIKCHGCFFFSLWCIVVSSSNFGRLLLLPSHPGDAINCICELCCLTNESLLPTVSLPWPRPLLPLFIHVYQPVAILSCSLGSSFSSFSEMVYVFLHSQRRVNNFFAGFNAAVHDSQLASLNSLWWRDRLSFYLLSIPCWSLKKRFVTDLARVLLNNTVAVSHTSAASVWILSAAC